MAFETQQDLDELQALLERSAASAGRHHRSIHGDDPQVTAVELVELLGDSMHVLDLGTVSSNGEPRVAPVDGHLYGGKWMFGSAPFSVRARHLARNPAASAAHTRGEGMCILTHGHVELLDMRTPENEARLSFLIDAYPNFGDTMWLDACVWQLNPTHVFVRYPPDDESGDSDEE